MERADGGPTTGENFIPAMTVSEAIARIYGLTGAEAKGRGEKRALVALRDALELDVDVVRTNAVLGQALANKLDIAWDASRFTNRTAVTLEGLNALLEGAAHAFRHGDLRRARPGSVSSLAGPEWADFRPAISKIEAVTRIAGLTGAPPESLGPGSKERRSVLDNLADRLFAGESLDRSSKTRLARDLAGRFDASWPDTAYSTGETISLEGLNIILAGAERRLGRLGSSTSDLLLTPEDEAAALLSALRHGLGEGAWDGRRGITWMLDNGIRGAFDNEWQGFYFEARGKEILSRSFVPSMHPPRSTYGNTTFDYALRFVWDLKVHTASKFFPSSGTTRPLATDAVLNDAEAMRRCVAEQGLGFLLLSGAALMDDDGMFVEWHRALKSAHRVRTQPSNSGRSRTRKAAFQPFRLDALWISDAGSLDAAVAAGWLRLFTQGRQAPKEAGSSGRKRRPKYMLSGDGASRLRIAEEAWPTTGPRTDSSDCRQTAPQEPVRLW